MERQLSIIPYSLIDCLRQIQNIYEMRLFGWVIAKSQAVLKMYDKNLGHINMEHAMDVCRVTIPAGLLMGDGEASMEDAKKAFELAKKTFITYNEHHEKHINIIAMPEYYIRDKRAFVSFIIHRDLWQVMLNFSRGYRLIKIDEFMRLSSVYAVIFYILVSNQTTAMEYRITTLKAITGTMDKRAYARSWNFIEKVVKSAQKELTEKTSTTFDIETTRSGRGGAYSSIWIIPRKTAEQAGHRDDGRRSTEIEKQRIRLTDAVIEYLQQSFQMTPKEIECIEADLQRVGDEFDQLNYIGNMKTQMLRRKIANKKGYLYEALRNRS